MAALTVLMFFIIIGLLDTVHLRPAVGNANGGAGEQAYSVEVLSLLDLIATPCAYTWKRPIQRPLPRTFTLEKQWSSRMAGKHGNFPG